MSEDFIREVDEELKEEQRIKLWKKTFTLHSQYIYWNCNFNIWIRILE